MSQKRDNQFLSIAEVAQLLGLTVDTIYHGKAGTKSLPRVKLGKRLLFSKNAITDWMERKVQESEILSFKKKREERSKQEKLAEKLARRTRRQAAIKRAYLNLVEGKK